MSSSSDIGEEVEAGLPELSGQFGIYEGTISYNGTTNGVFGRVDIGTDAYRLINDGEIKPTGMARVGFSASKSNAIYGNSETVQPPAIRAKVWERIA